MSRSQAPLWWSFATLMFGACAGEAPDLPEPAAWSELRTNYCDGELPGDVVPTQQLDDDCEPKFRMGACIRDQEWEGYQLWEFRNGEGGAHCAMLWSTEGTLAPDPDCEDCVQAFDVLSAEGGEWDTRFCSDLGVDAFPWETRFGIALRDGDWQLLRRDGHHASWVEMGHLRAALGPDGIGLEYDGGL